MVFRLKVKMCVYVCVRGRTCVLERGISTFNLKTIMSPTEDIPEYYNLQTKPHVQNIKVTGSLIADIVLQSLLSG